MPSHSNRAESYPSRILVAVIDFLCSTGTSHAQIRSIVERRLCRSMPATARAKVAPQRRGDGTVSAAVLHRWHRDRRLLDDEAFPKPLRLYGAAPSVESVVRSERPKSAARKIVGDMIALGLLRPSVAGKFVPRAREATVGKMHPVMMEHVANSLVRLLETVQANIAAPGTKLKLIERFTHVPDLPASRESEFRAFAQEHGGAFLASVDDWLESRRAKNVSRNAHGLAAGIHVYAYLEEKVSRKVTRPARRA